jgi:site-specific DNA recombinase
LTVAGYVRVSRSREDMVSPEIQRSEIERYCAGKGWTVSEFFEDLDISGRTDKRPGLQSMLRRAQDGEFQAVVFYRIDRLSREPMHHYAILAALKEAGVAVDSVGQPADDSPESGFMWDLSAALAKLESLRHGKRIRDAHRTLRAKGRYPGGPTPPYGLRRRPGGGLEPDPVEGPLLVEMHRRYQQGWSLGRITKDLNERGVPSKLGGFWLVPKVRDTLLCPYAAGGRLVDDQLVIGDNMAPLIDRETWERTRALMRSRAGIPVGRTPKLALTGKLVRCGTCGCALVIHYRGDGRPAYRCQRHAQGVCAAGAYIYAEVLEPEVVKRLCQHLKGLSAPAPAEPADDFGPIFHELRDVDEALENLAVALALGQIGPDEHQGARRRLIERQGRLRKQMQKQAKRLEDEAIGNLLGEIWEDLGRLADHPALISELPLAERRELFEATIERIVVRPRGQKPRLSVTFRW